MRAAILLGLVLSVEACGGGTIESSAPSTAHAPEGAERLSRGHAKFQALCARCHGEDGNGEGYQAPPWRQLPISAYHLRGQVRHGTAYRMPAFGEAELSDADLAELTEWLQSVRLVR